MLNRSATMPAVEFRDLAYEDPLVPAFLDGLTLTIPRGTTAAILCTDVATMRVLVRLVSRFLHPCRGTVSIHGQDLGRFSVGELRQAIAVVQANTFVFPGTFRENIAVARPTATINEIEQAAEEAGLHRFIQGLPQSYETPIGDGDGDLLGNRRALLGLGRALLRDPRVLVLEDFNPRSDGPEHGRGLSTKRTCLVVTCHPARITGADQAYLLHQGRILRRALSGSVTPELAESWTRLLGSLSSSVRPIVAAQ